MKAFGFAALFVLAPLFFGGRSAAAAAPDDGPSLVVLISVDQLRRDRLDAALPGGLGRLVREGRVFTAAELGHAVAETCPGHVALSTGRHPGPAGLAANYYVDRASGQVRYCVEDDPELSAVLGAGAPPVGRSPRRMRVDALGDWMKAADPRSRVFSVSAKDRSAIALGGQRPDGAYWLLRTGEVGFTTSRYYTNERPAWVRAFNGVNPARDGFLREIPATWEHAPGTRGAYARPDDYAHETPDYSRTSGHPLRDDALGLFADHVYVSPYADLATLDFALTLVREEGLGRGPASDLLTLGLSATDPIGHAYGPESHEARDGLLRLDTALGSFLAALETELGEGRLLVALSSDHGVLTIPEWLAETGRGTCPVDEGRMLASRLRGRLRWHLYRKIGPHFAWPHPWLVHSGNQMTVDRARAAETGIEVETVVRAAEAWLESQPGIVEAWTPEELTTRRDDMAVRYRRSYDPERSGDLIVQPAEGCLLSLFETGTSHGTPYGYDRDIPLVFWGAGVRAGSEPAPVFSVDVAPTLAHRLGVPVPAGLDGRPLLD